LSVLEDTKIQETARNKKLGGLLQLSNGTSQSQPWAGCVDSEVKKLVEFIIYDAS